MKPLRSFHGQDNAAALNYAWSLPWHAVQGRVAKSLGLIPAAAGSWMIRSRRAAPSHQPLR